MSEFEHKRIKLTKNLPEHLVEYILSSYFPIQSALQNRIISTKFRNGVIRSQNLDFSGLYSVRRRKLEVVKIIENILTNHKGSKIKRFVLLLNHIGVEDKILSWINTCLSKNIEELVLDFSKSKKVIVLPIDFSAIKTLTGLKLRWCKFEIPNNTPKGLKLLKTLSLMRSEITVEMIEAIFNNCVYFESLELIQCSMYGKLSINARNHKNFKSLSVISMPNLLDIVLDAPTLECYNYEGYVRIVDFSKVDALKEAKLHYIRSNDWHHYNPSNKVLANMSAYTRVHVLATTNIFLEALTYRYIDEEMRKPLFWFHNLKEFYIVMKFPTTCNLFDIAEFIEQCPKLERIVIDINDVTFEAELYWEIHQKPNIQNHNYNLKTIKFVEVNGYKNHKHELDIVEFFIKNAQFLEKLKLNPPTNPKIILYEPDYVRMNYIKSISPKKDLIEYVTN